MKHSMNRIDWNMFVNAYSNYCEISKVESSSNMVMTFLKFVGNPNLSEEFDDETKSKIARLAGPHAKALLKVLEIINDKNETTKDRSS